MTVMAVAVIGGAVVGAGASVYAANRSSDAIQDASNTATGETRRQYDLNRADMMPWMDSGKNALTRLDQVNNGDMSPFMASPDYNFRKSEGQKGINNIFSAGGNKYGGNALAALTDYNSNLASGEFGNWWNRQAGQAGIGQAATQQIGQQGMLASNQISNNIMNAGNAQASGYQQMAGGVNNAIQGGIGNYMYLQGLKTGGTGPGSPGWQGTGWIPRRT